MTLEQLDNLNALRRRLSMVEAIGRLAADNRNDFDDVRDAVAGMSLLLVVAGEQLGALIASGTPC